MGISPCACDVSTTAARISSFCLRQHARSGEETMWKDPFKNTGRTWNAKAYIPSMSYPIYWKIWVTTYQIYVNYIPLTWNPTSYIPSMSYPIYSKIVHHTFKSLPIYRHILVTAYHIYIYSHIYIYDPYMKSHIICTIHVLHHLLEDLSHNVSYIYIWIIYPLHEIPHHIYHPCLTPFFWKIVHHTFKSLPIYRQILVTLYQLYIYICVWPLNIKKQSRHFMSKSSGSISPIAKTVNFSAAQPHVSFFLSQRIGPKASKRTKTCLKPHKT